MYIVWLSLLGFFVFVQLLKLCTSVEFVVHAYDNLLIPILCFLLLSYTHNFCSCSICPGSCSNKVLTYIQKGVFLKL